MDAIFGASGSQLVIDVPHNVVMRENGLNVHRKGATPAHDGDFAQISGSMGDASRLVTGLGNPDWLWTCNHGAGRSVRRQQIRAQTSGDSVAEVKSSWGFVTLLDERRIEESQMA